VLIEQRGQLDPRREEHARKARLLLAACGTVPEPDPEHVIRASLAGLERWVGERGWLFQHQPWQA
jgi:hypothetical protein